jgi:hypothetical protein
MIVRNDFKKLLNLSCDRPNPEHERWSLVEMALRIELPATYKNMIDQFDDGSWGDFLHVLSPFSDNPHLNLMKKGPVILAADRTSRETFPAYYPLPLYPEAGGLFPWAVTDNGDTLYWITAARAGDWPTVIKGPRAPEIEVNYMPPHLLVCHFLSGTLRSNILPTIK